MARTYRYRNDYEENDLRNYNGSSRNALRNSLRDFINDYNAGNDDIDETWEDQEEFFTQGS